MALRYLTGEEIQRSDRVRFGGKVGVIEDVVEACTGTPEQDWLFETHGAGVMVAEPEVVGRIYLHNPERNEDLQFIGRAE